jgi:hypothetical protein
MDTTHRTATSLRLRSVSLALGLAFVAGRAVGQEQVPFTAGERLGLASNTTTPWLPDSVRFAAGDELALVASRGVAGGLGVLATHDAAGSDFRAYDGRYAGAQGATLVAAGERADAVFALAQYPDPDPYTRRVEVTRHDPMAEAATGSFAPVWVRELDLRLNGPAKLACDAAGDVVVAAAFDDRSGNVRIDRLDGSTGNRLARRDVPATGLSRLAFSADGRRVAFSAGLELWILDEQLHTVAYRALASSAQALAFDGEGRTLAVGGAGRLDVLRESYGGLYTAFRTFQMASHELASVTSLSEDGATLAVAWWNSSTGTSVRMELWDVAAALCSARYEQLGTPISRQNIPAAVAQSKDGQRAAFGLWGDGGTPEVVLLQAGRPLPVMAFDLPGSVRDLDLDETGTRILVGHKNVHNSQWGATGAVRLLDTGERTLEVVATPEVGGSLRAATRHAGAGIAFFALGQPIDVPVQFPGTQGTLLLWRGSMVMRAAAVDPSGRADLDLPLGLDPTLRGTRLHLQSVFRVQGGIAFSAERVDTLVL